jgi:hypothetical protein
MIDITVNINNIFLLLFDKKALDLIIIFWTAGKDKTDLILSLKFVSLLKISMIKPVTQKNHHPSTAERQ